MNTTNTTITAVTTNATSIDLSSTLAKFSVSVKDGKVVSNIVEVKSAMAAKKSELLSTEYVGTREEQMAMIRDAKAAVNKFKDATTKAKTSVKKELMKPFADFEKTANETIKMAEETYDDLNGRYLTLDAERKAEKRAKIRKEYDSIALECGVEEFADALYGLIYDTTWENTASSMKSIKESIKKSCESYVQGLSTLQMIQADDDIRKKALEMFNENLDAVKAMAYITSEMAARAEAKAREEARIEAERKRVEAEAAAKIEAERKRVEAEAAAKIEAERKKTEAEAKAREEARMKEMAAKIEAENKKAAVKPIARSEAECKIVEDKTVIQNKVTAESTSSAVTNVMAGNTNPDLSENSEKANNRIVVSFLPEDWEMVKDYCEVNGIFYSEK
ncbi:DUF1351 domain-containing protein [Roseburia intestinalis]|uniref:DUF1351 domain-containing protein n=1 Tax=Roseburia intestinalis TaxID=166486 RepID=A0A3R6EJX8_9FIRM|nr:DUF1351 domain-containing protein [Roseburia intestinalis]RHA66320.1 DUF1351 domain-containing protein [Roseburia intestinalis]